jgi:hypothetical protein
MLTRDLPGGAPRIPSRPDHGRQVLVVVLVLLAALLGAVILTGAAVAAGPGETMVQFASCH